MQFFKDNDNDESHSFVASDFLHWLDENAQKTQVFKRKYQQIQHGTNGIGGLDKASVRKKQHVFVQCKRNAELK